MIMRIGQDMYRKRERKSTYCADFDKRLDNLGEECWNVLLANLRLVT